MEYLQRELERKFLKMNQHFKAILVTGARQVGKTTMLKHLAEGTNRTYVTLDNRMAREIAQNDPVLFFQISECLRCIGCATGKLYYPGRGCRHIAADSKGVA